MRGDILIIRSDNSYIQNPLFPDSNFLELEGVIVIDDNSVLAEKFIRLFPHGRIVTDGNGAVVDVEDNTPVPVPQPPEPPTRAELAAAIAELAEVMMGG